MISKTEIAKLVAKTIVASKVSTITQTQIASHTNLNEEDTTVQVAGHVVGYVVSCKTEPHTDAMVEKAAAWIKVKKEARNNK
jgi:hypothetical protein